MTAEVMRITGKGDPVTRYTLILSVVVGFATLLAPAAAADGVTVSAVPISFSLFNPCTSEVVDFSGTARVVIDTTPDNHGLLGHSTEAIKGVGQTTGAQYVETFINTVSVQGTEGTSDNGAYAETTATHSRLIAPGPANDLVFSIVSHFTINANGEVVGFHNRVTFEDCV
jgi:hypothetical protein